MHLVDEVDLVAAARRRVLHVVEQVTRVLDLGARSGVHFDQVDETPVVDVATGRADAAGRGRDALLAIQRLGKNPGNGGLADAARAGEQVGMVQPVVVQRVHQGAQHVFLAHQVGEQAGAPLAGKRLITHGLEGEPGIESEGRQCTTAATADTPFSYVSQ